MKKVSLNKILLLVVGVALSATPTPSEALSLSLEDYRAAKILACYPMTRPHFSLSFIHSVSLTPVTDRYQITDSDHGNLQILQTEEQFVTHGQGLPSLTNEPDALHFETKKDFFILHLNRPIPDLIVRLDTRFKNRLHLDHHIINLNQWPDGLGVRIRPVSHCD